LRLIGFLGGSGRGNWPSGCPFFFVCFWRFVFTSGISEFYFVLFHWLGGGAGYFVAVISPKLASLVWIFWAFGILRVQSVCFEVSLGILLWTLWEFLFMDDDPGQSEAFFIFYWKAKTFVQFTPWFSASGDDNRLLCAFSIFWIWAVHVQIAKCDEHLFRVLIAK